MKKKDFILLIDAEEANRQELKNILAARFDLQETQSAQEALIKLRENKEKPKLAICSSNLTDMDVFEFLSKIKKEEALQKTGFLFVAEAGEAEKESKAVELGAIDTLTRPFNPDIVKNRVTNAIQFLELPVYHNAMEGFVEMEIEECIDKLPMCKCETCRLDLLTFVLNRMKPKYVRTQRGELMSKLDRTMTYEARVEVISAIASAAQIIGKQPHHDNT